MSEKGKDKPEMEEEEEEYEEDPDEEVLDEKPKSIILALLKQLRPGMDMHRIALPTFVLETRSLLEKLTDFLTHPHLIADASLKEDPLERMINVVRWYLSGWHIQPKGVKKPYNPILGEMFRCEYTFDDTKQTYMAEQVSHHPPISAFYSENRKKNLVMNGYYYPRSKFFGTSAGSIAEGHCDIYLLDRKEKYEVTWPNVYVKGILFGRFRMELGGKVHVSCQETGYRTELEFKTKGLFTGEKNGISGKIKHASSKKTLYKISGRWDQSLKLKNEKTGEESILFDSSKERIVKKRVKKFDLQEENESRKVWVKLTEALRKGDQKAAGDCKFEVEESERDKRKEREREGLAWEPKFFRKVEGGWEFKNINLTPYEGAEEEKRSEAGTEEGLEEEGM